MEFIEKIADSKPVDFIKEQIEKIADGEATDFIKESIEKLVDKLTSAYESNPEIYIGAGILLAVFLIGYIGYRLGKRSVSEIEENKKHIRYEDIDWTIQDEADTSPQDEFAPQAETTSEAEAAPQAETTPEAEAAPQVETPPEAEAAPQVETPPEVKVEPQAETPQEVKAVSTEAPKTVDESIVSAVTAPAAEPAQEPTILPNTDNSNRNDKESESVKVEQINLIKALPYRKFGPDNRDTNRSGRIFTEEELMKQIRD